MIIMYDNTMVRIFWNLRLAKLVHTVQVSVDIVYDYNVQSKVWESVKNESLEEN